MLLSFEEFYWLSMYAKNESPTPKQFKYDDKG